MVLFEEGWPSPGCSLTLPLLSFLRPVIAHFIVISQIAKSQINEVALTKFFEQFQLSFEQLLIIQVILQAIYAIKLICYLNLI